MILLDTHVLIWLRLDSRKLGSKSRHLISHHWRLGTVSISAISFWEIAMLIAKGRLKLVQDVETWRLEVLNQGVSEVPISGQVGIKAATLSGLHGDPADRIIVATACDGYQLVTADQMILGWEGPLDRFDAQT